MSECTCSIEGCSASIVARGWCRSHYNRWHRHGDPLHEKPVRLCRVPGCGRRCFGYGWCEMHYARVRKTGSTDRRPNPLRLDRGTSSRVCAACGSARAAASYDRDSSRWDGLRRECKDCEKDKRAARATTESVAARKARRRLRRLLNLESEQAKQRAEYKRNPSRFRAQSQLRRARKRSTTVERFTDREIFDRDGWRCGICGRAISRRRAWPDPLSVSLDHIVPIARGGGHTRANTQASHLRCNLRKHCGGIDQLKLIG